MIEAELRRFVRDSLSKRVGRRDIVEQLAAAGWPEEKIRAALEEFADLDAAVPVPRPKPYLSARETFVYLLLFTTLYISAYNLGGLLFGLIERAFPDAARAASYGMTSSRWSVAAIIIAFPAYLLLARSVRATLIREPAKRNSKIRKWLTYVTLFVAAATILGDLITLVHYFLGGELTRRFLLKVATVALISGTVFGYYLWDLRGEEEEGAARGLRPEPGRAHALFVWSVVAAVSLAVVAGVAAVGSPGRARATSIDQQRRSDLESIAGAVDRYWEKNGKLPSSLDSLAEDRATWVPSIRDPVSTERYGYSPGAGTAYELCADFDAPSQPRPGGIGGRAPSFWSHGPGRACFALEAD